MKRLIFMLCMVTVIPVFAQKVTWMVHGGPSINTHYSGFSNGSVRFGGRFGVGMEYQLSHVFSIQPSLMLSFKGNKSTSEIRVMKTTSESTVYKYTKRTWRYEQTYLEMPVNAQFRLHLRRGNAVTWAVGPYFAYGIGGNTKYSRIVAESTMHNTDGTTWTEGGDGTQLTETVSQGGTFSKNGADFCRFDMGINGAVHFELKKFMMGLYMEEGLMKLDKEHESNVIVNYLAHNKNFSFGLDLGYRF